MTQITTVDLVYLNEAIKALKQSNVFIAQDTLIGVNEYSALIYIKLDRMITEPTDTGYYIVAKELSEFIKTITTELTFEVDHKDTYDCITSAFGGMVCFNKNPVVMLNEAPLEKLAYCNALDVGSAELIDINYIADILRNMHVADGYIGRVIEGHYVTLFPTMFPLVKADKLYVQFYDIEKYIFMAKYTIRKKHFNIYMYICYLSM